MWACRSADQGHASGEHLLGSFYRYGYGVPIDLRVAASWYARSAAHGSEDSKKHLCELAAAGVSEAVAAARRLGLLAP